LSFSPFRPGGYRFRGASSKTDIGIGPVVGYVKQLNFWRPPMARGTVKWFNPTKGYGFIQPQGGGKDVFVHISAVEKAGLTSLNEGQSFEYEEVSNRGKTSAENLKVQR
jgi:cold shock protein